jgi:hypothetical protein
LKEWYDQSKKGNTARLDTNRMAGSLPQKLGIKEGMRAIFVNAPSDVLEALGSSGLNVASKLTGRFDYIHVFTKSHPELEDTFSRLKDHLKPNGMVWISWPKNRQLDTDLTMTKIIKIGYDHGLVESKCVSVDATWSGIKFTLPIHGKVYNNRYGQLKRE